MNEYIYTADPTPTEDLVRGLRDYSRHVTDSASLTLILTAADRLEEMDERIAIMLEGVTD